MPPAFPLDSGSDSLLTNIIALTEQRDQHSLEESLLAALEDTLEPNVLFAMEWSDAQTPYRVVLERPNDPRPPPGILEAAREFKAEFRALGGAEGVEWLMLGVEAMAENTSRVLILGLPTWRSADVNIARGMLRVYQNFVRLLNDSEKDTLTGLMNRRRLEKHLSELLASRRLGRRNHDHHRQDFLAVLDIDRFKSVNDNYGHLIGDEVLLLFANVMRQTLRDEDRCYRYGGEEFIVLLRDVSRQDALMIMERLRRGVSDHVFPQVGHVTVSIGVTLVEHQRLPPQIIEEADRALYYAKSHGRDQVREFQALVAAGEIELPEISGSVELF
ncbi:MAG TPA: GGDEF domain-containing protein [Thiobacillaceae bacterium]|nr:GGDEF domain-containing protein [Thiobacillaceae bacterium]HNA83494.1 GGDEF domain-containing protein [Thiobacillaceae bacterium]HNH90077.1 GGDEF domain-containing protein [Thiobacillaceae bacterium]HNI08385.1 GGDEF domain-containing protein [Thiobacillaceae bacterium]